LFTISKVPLIAVTDWITPPSDTELHRDEVHVWRVALDQPPDTKAVLLGTLSEDERARAERFRFERDRAHFVAARGALRCVLGRYLGAAPGALRFNYDAYGKPSLAPEFAGGELEFNLSHSHSLALVAVARGRAVGVDVERVRAEVSGPEIAERFFSPPEFAALRALPAAEQTRAFFDCWTRKEAFVKARGEGLSHPLDEFDVSLAPGEPAALLSVRNDPREAARWSLRALDAGAGYAAALAVEGVDWRLSTWQWEPARLVAPPR
jgi:4'-phosphopantetheinyl transferase